MDIGSISYINGLEISVSTCTEYPILYKAELIKPTSHLGPSLKTAQIFPALQFINWSLNKEVNASMSTTFSLVVLPLTVSSPLF
jgi:hypothetical protein